MFLTGTYSQMGRSTAGHLDNLRRQLGEGVDPAFDYSHMTEMKKEMFQKKDKTKKTKEERPEVSGGLGELRQAIEKAQAPVVTHSADEDEDAVEDSVEGSPQARGTQARKRTHKNKASRAFLSPTRAHMAKQDLGSRWRAPDVGKYRPKMASVELREHGADFTKREPTRNRKSVELEKEIEELQAQGQSVDGLSKYSNSVDYLDEAPQRLRQRKADVDFSKQSARPDMVKQAGIVYHDNSFTAGVMEGDCVTGKIMRKPSWDFAKLSTMNDKPKETFFQPGQYKVDGGLSVTRPRMEVKNIGFSKQTKRKLLVETQGLFEIKSRLGDHLPDRSLARSCPALSSQHQNPVAQFKNYSNRRPLVDPKKPYHLAEDPDVDQAVLHYSLTHDEMESAKTLWSRTRTGGKFESALKREEHLRTQRSYGNDVALRMAKDNLSRGPVSVELLDEVDNKPQLQPRVKTRDFEYMGSREMNEGKYKENPSRGKDMTEALRFARVAHVGDGRMATVTFAPSAGVIAERRKARTYSALESGIGL